MNIQRYIVVRVLFLSSFLFSVNSFAAELSDIFSVHGFGTIGATKTNDPDMGYRSNISTDNVTYDDWNLASRSLVGVQVNARWNEHWSSAVQFVQQKQPGSTFEDKIQVASVNYMPTPEWVFRLGRSAPRMFMLTDTRNVGFGYLWTHPPIEFYGQLQTTYIDGVLTTYTKQIDDDSLSVSLAAGKATLPMSYPSYNFKADLGESAGLTVEYEHNDWLFRGTASRVVNKYQWADEVREYLDRYSTFVPGTALLSKQLDTHNAKLWFYTLGASYNNPEWVIQSEISRLMATADVIPESISGYLSIGRHIGAFTPYVMYSRIHTTSPDDSLSPDVAYASQYDSQLNYLAQTSLAFINSRFDQSGVAIGVRWDINSKLALKTQWDRKYINAYGGSLEWNINSANKVTDILSLNLDFVF